MFADFNRELIADLRAHGGRASRGPFKGVEILILTTTGANSGQVRENPLAFSRHGEHLVVVASNYGSPRSPDWYHNLVANPLVTVELLGERFQARARVPQGHERALLYARLADRMPGFLEAQMRTSRQIPIIVLERLPAG